MKFIAIAAAAFTLLASCSFAAPLDGKTDVLPLELRAADSSLVVLLPESQLLERTPAAVVEDVVVPEVDIATRSTDVVVAAIVDVTVQIKAIVKLLSVKGITLAEVKIHIAAIVKLIVGLEARIRLFGYHDSNVVDIAVALNALIVLCLNVFISLKVFLGLEVLIGLIADVRIALQALINICLVVVVGLDVHLFALLKLHVNILVVLGINLYVGVLGLLGLQL